MRLSHGFVRGEALSCIYHGWSYSQTGNCLRIPAHPDLVPPETIRVTTYPVEEAGGVVWVADGAPTAKPPALDGFTPLRSLTVRAAHAAIETAAGATAVAGELFWQPPDASAVRLLVGPTQDGDTLIHVLVPAGCSTSERLSASRATETLRRSAEQIELKEVAS